MLAIAAGGALGALARFWVVERMAAIWGRSFPYGTLLVNVSGCLLMGMLYVLLVERAILGPQWKAALLVGWLGAFTTFSSFSMETLVLLEAGAWLRAGAYVAASVFICIAVTWAGAVGTRAFIN